VGIRIRLAFLRGVRGTAKASRARAATRSVLSGRVVTGGIVTGGIMSAIAVATASAATLGMGCIKHRRHGEEVDRDRGCDERQRQDASRRNSATRETMFHDVLHAVPVGVVPNTPLPLEGKRRACLLSSLPNVEVVLSVKKYTSY
jgi:hypothetical protein